MFQSISWTEFLLMIGVALLIYYGWWMAKYAASLGWRFPQAKSPQANGRLTALYMDPAEKAADPGTEPMPPPAPDPIRGVDQPSPTTLPGSTPETNPPDF